MTQFKNAACKGCYAFGTACGKCEKCFHDPMRPISDNPGALLNTLTEATPQTKKHDKDKPIDVIFTMVHDLNILKSDPTASNGLKNHFNEAIEKLDALTNAMAVKILEKENISKPLIKERKRDIILIEDMAENLRTAKNYIERSQEIRSAFNEALDRLAVLVSKLNEEEKTIKQLTKQQCINYWGEDNITEEDTNYFVKRIKEHGFHNSVPPDAQAAMRSWAECEPSEENGKYLKAFAEIARLALGIA